MAGLRWLKAGRALGMIFWYPNTKLESFMNFSRQVSRVLDDEHRNLLDLLGQIERALTRAPRAEPALAALIGRFAQALELDVDRHFRFEEEALFPRLAEAGDGPMTDLLSEEHAAIREVALELLPLARAAQAGTIGDADWSEFRRGTLEIVERQVAHIQKETMALLPLLDDLLDDESDRELAFAYAAQ
jgi:hemerythrin-like domain-containing protein